MRLSAAAWATSLAITLCPTLGMSADGPSAPQPDDRLILGANGSTLTGSSGGGGASVTWLHGMSASSLIGVGAQYQTIADSHWSFASLTGSLTRARWSFYGEVHQGAGKIGQGDFDYSVLSAGANYTLIPGLSLQIEDRQIDIDTSHGNLPKLGFSYFWNPKLATGLWYARSVGGNLGTKLVSTRIDYYGARASFLAGGAVGPAAPAIVNLQTGITQERRLKQVFVGVGKPFSRADLQLVVDYLDLTASDRLTVSLTCNVRLRGTGASK
jgi:hypothetical protein